MGGPLDLDVRADLHPLLAVLQLLPVEVDIAEVEDGGDDLEDDVLLLRRESQDLHGGQKVLEVIFVDFAVNIAAAALVEVEILLSAHQAELLSLLLSQPRQHLIEDVVVPLLGGVGHNPGLLQQILGDLGPGDEPVLGDKYF